MPEDVLLLGVDGGGTQCRARLAGLDGIVLGEGRAGPANIRLGLAEAFAAVWDATKQCLRQAGLSHGADRIVACLALAGASEPAELARARVYPHPFRQALVTSDARAACVGAHAGGDGGIVIVGTGSVGWAIVADREHRVGGWGFPVSDEASGAWLGCGALRRVLWAHDGLLPWSGLLRAVFDRFDRDPHAIVRWMSTARPWELATIAPLVVAHAAHGDAVGRDLMQLGARHIDAIAARLLEYGAPRIALMGGLGDKMEPYVSDRTRLRLVHPLGDGLSGALHFARLEAQRLAVSGG